VLIGGFDELDPKRFLFFAGRFKKVSREDLLQRERCFIDYLEIKFVYIMSSKLRRKIHTDT